MALPPTYVPGFHDEAAVRRMRYNALGNTGMLVSHIGFGGAAIGGGPLLFGEYEEAEAIATVQEALKQGINYIDTAPWYGQGRSEELLGKALKGVPRKAYYIATKVARYEIDLSKRFDFTARKTLASVDVSLKKLGLDYVDLIQIHDVEFAPSIDMVLNETLPALESVVKAGKARHVGVTGYPVSHLKEITERSTVKLSTILSYSRNTLLDDTLIGYVPYFKSKGLGVISAAGVSMGLLTNNGPQSWHIAAEHVKKACADAGRYCKEQGVELGRLAQYHTINQPGPATNLIGMNSREILRSNLNILLEGLTKKEKQVLEEVKEKYLNPLKPYHWENVEIQEMKKLGFL